MKENYFLINGITYIVSYNDFKLEIYKLVDNERMVLSDTEKEYMNDIIKKNSSYIYASRRFDEIISTNASIYTNQYAPHLIEWLESIIPIESRDNFYKNLETLRIEELRNSTSENVVGTYDAKENVIRIANTGNEQEYSKTLLHELIHMASSHYDKETDTVVSGFDTLQDDYNKRNRGLTEGIAEVISRVGVPMENAEKECDIEASIAGQLAQVVGEGTIIDSYFSSNGTARLEKELTSLIEDDAKVYELFRNIESNYYFNKKATKQNVVGKFQSTLIDYFDKKCENEIFKEDTKIDNIVNMISSFERSLITPEKVNDKEETKYDELSESVIKFSNLKDKYSILLGQPFAEQEQTVDEAVYKKTGFSNLLILSIITAILCIGILVFGIWTLT